MSLPRPLRRRRPRACVPSRANGRCASHGRPTSSASASSSTCACCGGSRLSKLGEDVTETLEEIPRRFKVIETVREKFTCRDCEKISQPPAPFHATPRGFIGPQLLAALPTDRAPCARGRAPSWRRHHHSHPGERQVRDRAHMDLYAR
ncbi:IS66 family transposase zinc-finger binding domain-containing protein [Mesorhizobium sp.]|uniref:IS66 family transposase zinc-finger binding domain-containing protein n=1 Tax=Mesorhizobium sp. TaxID=1871066 RepID=UPI00258693C3|nr:IS66 family transposase zinc-finger binding domain-containing protein [Mesorhizobium sp.]